MRHLHGVVTHGGHSQGGPISSLDDELSEGSHDVMRVLSASDQSMAVSSSSVCCLPADSSKPLSWTAMSPLDTFPENNHDSIGTPLTLAASIHPPDILRRDSAISFVQNDDRVTGNNLQTLQPANSSRFSPGSAPVPAQAYEPQFAMTNKLKQAAHPHDEPLSLFNKDCSPCSSYPQAAATMSTMINPSSSEFQPHYMRMRAPYDFSSEVPHHERRMTPTQPVQAWTQPAFMPGYAWQGQRAHQYPEPVPATQTLESDTSRFHDSFSFPPDSRRHHFQMMDSLESYDISRAQGGRSQAPSTQDAVPQNCQLTFYRALEQHTMSLTDDSYYKPRRSRNGRRPKREPRPIPEEQALRPHIVLEYFRRQVKPDVDALEARQRELGDRPTDEARARLVSEALELVRPAVEKVTSALEALPPRYLQPWGKTQKRMQNDAEQILSMIQIVRRSALEEAALRQHEPRPASDGDAKPRKNLTALAQDYVNKAECVGRVTGHGARKENTKTSQHAAADRSQTMAYTSNSVAPVDWTHGQGTMPPPHHRSGTIGHYQQQHQHMQNNTVASSATNPAMLGFGLHESCSLLPTVSATPIADAAMATVMAPSDGRVGPVARMPDHKSPPRVSAAGLGPVQSAPLGYGEYSTHQQ